MPPWPRSGHAALAAAVVAGCLTDYTIGPGAISSLAVSPTAIELGVGETRVLIAVARDENGAPFIGVATAWTSDDSTVVMISPDGIVTGVAVGMTRVTATVRDFTATADVTVRSPAEIALSAASVAFAAVAGGPDPATDSVTITNTGGVALTELALDPIDYGSGPLDWLTASLGGTTAPATLTLSAATGSLPQGAHTATVPVRSPRAANSPQHVTVTFTLAAGPPAAMAIGTGDGQTAPVGSAVPVAPAVMVRDQYGNPAPGAVVTFAVAAGGGSVAGAVDTSDVTGVASVGSWTLGTTTGQNTLTATAAGLAGSPVTFVATAAAGAATQMVLNGGNGQVATVNTTVASNPSVGVRDQFGNPVPNVTVTFAVTAGGGAVTGGTATTDPTGTAAVGSWRLGTTAGTSNNALQATATGLTGSPVTFTASATAGAATQLALNAGNNQTAPVNSAVPVVPSVVARDQFGNPVANVGVTFQVTAGGGSVAGGGATTGPAGVAAPTSWTLGTAAGTNNNTLQATAAGLTGSPVTFTASAAPGNASQITVSAGNNQTAPVNGTVAVAPAVLVRDQFNNAVANVGVTFAIASGGGSLTGGTATTGTNGVAAVGSWRLGTGAGANTLTATATGLAGSPVTFTATGTAGPATQISKAAGDNQSATAGSTLPVAPAVLVGDQFNNPVAGITVSYAVASGGGSVTGAAPVSGTDGLAVIGSWTLGPAPGPNSLTATAPGLAGSPLTFAATGISGSAANIALAGGNAQTDTVGATLPVAYTVLVTDNAANPVPGISVSWTVTGGGGSVSPAASTTNASGIAAATRTLGTGAGTQTATASVGGLAGSPVQFTATATAGTATQMALDVGNNQTATVNTTVAVAPAVIVRDQFGNPRGGSVVTFAVTAGGGVVTAATPTADGNGRATVGSWRLGTAAGTANNALQATAALTGSPVTFTASATAGPATQMSLNGGNNQTTTVNTAVPVAPSVLVRDAFNNPVQGHGVTFAVTGGGGSLAGGNATSGPGGIAAVGSWTLGTGAGPNALQASATGLTGSPVGFAATGTAGPPSGSVSAIATTGPITACASGCTTGGGTQATVTITVRDAFGNPISGAGVTWSASGSANTATGTSGTTDAGGVFNAGRLSSTAAQTKTISATINGSVAITPTGSVVVNPGAVSLSNSLVAASDNSIAACSSSCTTGGNTASVITVTVRDGFSNPIAGQAVSVSCAVGSSCAFSPASGTTNATGQFSSTFNSTLAQAKTIRGTATSVGDISQTAGVTVTAAAAATVAVNGGSGQTARVGTVVAVGPSALVRDAFLNPVLGATVTFTPTAGGGSVTGGSQTTNASGIATVTSWTLGGTSADAADGTMANTLSASASGATSATFTASAIYTWSGDANAVVGSTSGCAGCHGFQRNPNNIVGVASSGTGSCPGRTLVVAGSAATSLVYQKINWPAPCGSNMPTAPSPQLTATQLKIVRAWINNGGQNN